jgi:transposase
MPLRNIYISEADANAANYEMFHHVDPTVQKRMMCLRMKFLKYQHQDIADLIGISRNTVGNYLSVYESSGMKGLRTVYCHSPKSELDHHRQNVEADFRNAPPRSVKEAAQRIEKMTGIKRSLGRVRHFLKRIGMSARYTGQIPAKVDVEKQRSFHDQILQPLLSRSEKGECHVLFADSAHFVLAAFVAMVWCFERVFVKTASGRFRLNVLGVIHAKSKKLTALYNTTYITSDTVVELLAKVAKEYAGKPIFIILDNARYQHCELVKRTAEALNINLVFLPPYSPNLNLIERLWKFVKAEVCAAKYFPDAKSFQKEIVDFLNNLNQKHMKKELKSRLTLNFQLFDHAQIVAA